ncbi:hypothetical protein M2427_008482 [Bradyrhizobium sp. BR13661]|jgi:hypothetical protein|nr:hypothetical protein [Bradyrhizobium sp. BR13661]
MTKCAGSQADGVWAMPSARALLVASLLTEPPFGCLGPSGNDRYRKRSEAMGASQVSCQVAAAVSGTGDRETTTVGRLFKSGFEIAVHGDKTAVAESGAWCNDLEGRCHKGELR